MGLQNLSAALRHSAGQTISMYGSTSHRAQAKSSSPASLGAYLTWYFCTLNHPKMSAFMNPIKISKLVIFT
ncbi:hypothetical protein XENTR_v10013640 [Xenopus tropicalis]|nr:hypothetical protein XENTR_v10013640 [Xenopus tropicalis]